MSIQSVQSSPILQNFLDPMDLDQEIKKAISGYDMDLVKELISRGASGEQQVFLVRSSEKIFSCVKDRAFMQALIEEIYSDFEYKSAVTEEVSDNFQKLNEWLFEGDPLSKRFVQLFTKVLDELDLLYFSEDELNDIHTKGHEVSLFEFAVLVRDLELIEFLLDSGLSPKINELRDASFLLIQYFTETNLSIIESLLSRGFSLDDLLVRNETFDRVLSVAEDEENELLLSFLRKHEVLSKKETVGDLSLVQKV